MARRVSFSEQEIREMLLDGNVGICRYCGMKHYGVEPDVDARRCEGCGRFRVAGVETLLLEETLYRGGDYENSPS